MAPLPPWLHTVLTVVVPCLFGGLMYAGFDLWERRRQRHRPDERLPPIDYFI